MGLKPAVQLTAALALAGALGAVACIREVDLPETDLSVPFVDGVLLVDSTEQILRLGRTDGRREATTPLSDASVSVTDLTTGVRYDYAESADERGRYGASFAGALGHAYQLAVDIPGVGRYTSRPDSLAAGTVTVASASGIRGRLDRDGVRRPRPFVGTELTLTNTADAQAEGFLTLRSSLVWRYADLSCSGMDPITTCWFDGASVTDPFVVFDLADLGGRGDTAVFFAGEEFVDYRFAEVAFLVTRVFRYAPAAGPYFEALARALTPAATILAERPRPVIGNMRPADGAEVMLGYFGVAESTPQYLSTALDNNLRGRSGGPLCGGSRGGVPGFDCCECIRTDGALADKPAYLP